MTATERIVLPGGDLATPSGFAAWSAAEKHEWIWRSLILEHEYDPVGRPEVTLPMPWVMLSVAGRPSVLERTLDMNDDVMPGDRPKIIHPFGAVAMVELDIDPEVDTPYTGVLDRQRGGATGLVRLSLAAPATRDKSITPGMGLKLFVDGAPSLDLLAMNHTVGQGRDFNLFSNTFTHDLRRKHKELRPPQKLMKVFFERVTSEPRRLTIDHFAAVQADGSPVAAPTVPGRLRFTPHPDAAATFERRHGDDFRDPLRSIPVGTRLWHVEALEPDPADVSRANDPDWLPSEIATTIGTIRTTSRFICSLGGDRLFFRHHVDDAHRRRTGLLARLGLRS